MNVADLFRMRALPQQTLPDFDYAQFLRRSANVWLFPVQNTMLDQARRYNGLLGAVGVGVGKTLTWCLLPTVLNARCTVVLVPASARPQGLAMLDKARQDWKISDNIHLMSYGILSRQRGADELDDLEPDLLIADEAHLLKDAKAGRTRRVTRYLTRHPETRFVALSGTLLKKRVMEYWHLSELALRNFNPLPRSKHTAQAIGELVDFGGEPAITDQAVLQAFGMNQEQFRAWYRYHLNHVGGVVISEGLGGVDSSLVVSQLETEPLECYQYSDRMDESPNGGYYLDSSDRWRNLYSLTLGWYYREVWPQGEDTEWKNARSTWSKAARWELDRVNQPGYDTPSQVEEAILKGKSTAPSWVCDALIDWQRKRRDPGPELEAVWIDDTRIKQVLDFGRSNNALLWYQHIAVADKLEQLGCLVYRAGQEVSTCGGCVALSVTSHGKALNLQDRWSVSVVLEPPSDSDMWEQLIGRTHRQGQEADCVIVYVACLSRTFQNAFNKAMEGARYTEERFGVRQKLVFATHTTGKVKHE